jgi:hypothetical protein
MNRERAITSPMPYAQASRLALEAARRLEASGSVERARIAGSVRRQKGISGGEGRRDIELVCVPGTYYEMEMHALLKAGLLQLGRFEPRGNHGWGHKMCRATFYHEGQVAPCDLFLVRRPAEWGVIFALRTGPGDFNRTLVTHAHRLDKKASGGRLWVVRDGPSSLLRLRSNRFLAEIRSGGYWITPLPCTTERDFFEQLDVPYWQPPLRTDELLREYLTLSPRRQREWRKAALERWKHHSPKETDGTTQTSQDTPDGRERDRGLRPLYVSVIPG